MEAGIGMVSEPTSKWLTQMLWLISASGFVLVSAAKVLRPSTIRAGLRRISVGAQKINRAVREIERKTFHLAGLGVPLGCNTLVSTLGLSESLVVGIWALVSICVVIIDVARLYFPSLQHAVLASPLGRIMRPKEINGVTGTASFFAGCALTASIFPRPVAIIAMLHLVLGDMTAALVGVAFGGETVVVKLGRGGHKSVEGSLAMALVCFATTVVVFIRVPFIEYVAAISAVAATVAELYSEDYFGINDNLAIPLASSAAMSWALARVSLCSS